MSSKIQDCLFPNLGIVRNIKPTYVFFYIPFPKDTLTEKHVSIPYQSHKKFFYVFNKIIYQKYEPTQSSIYSFVCYQFAIYFYLGSIGEESTEDMEKKPLTSYN